VVKSKRETICEGIEMGRDKDLVEGIYGWRVEFFEGALTPLPRVRRTWKPPTDVYETDSHIVVKVEVAGMKPEDFEISLSSRTLTISGVRMDPAEKLTYQQMEISYGRFETQVYIPGAIEEDKIEAIYEDGFLKVLIPKAKAVKLKPHETIELLPEK